MQNIGTFLLILASISFITVIGGATYEHLAVVPVWSAAVPASLSMFQGEYRLAAENFWIPIHPITLLLFAVSLAFNWRTKRRNFILIPFVGYFVILILTFLYFVPELMAITQSSFSLNIDPELTRRAQTWELLSLIRLAVLVFLASVLLFGLSRLDVPEETTAN